MKYEIKTRFSGGVIYTAEIEADENAAKAIKLGLAVRAAYLSGAYLSGANLSGANLSDASHIIDLGQRSDGYQFYAQIREGKIWILAGCRYMSIKDAAKHWKDTREDTPLGNESQQLLKQARALVKIRGML